MQQQASIKSVEASGSIALELVPGTGKFADDEDKMLFDLLRAAKLTLHHVSMQDVQHESVEGTFTYGKGSIPFQATVDGNRIVLEIDGANKPIVFESGSAATGAVPVSPLSLQLQQQLQAKSTELAPLLAKFLFRNAPNPEKLDVSGSTETVHGQTMSLQKVHAELTGSELKELLEATLRSITNDEAGLKELLGQLYDLFVPLLKENIRQEYEQNRDGNELGTADDGIGIAMAYLDNKTLAVEFLYTTIKQYLAKAVEELDKKDDKPALPGAGSASLLNDKTQLKADLYVDGSLNIRKEKLDLYVPSPDDKPDPLAAVRITSDMELWNHNEKITVQTPDVKDALILNNDTSGTDQKLLGNFKSDSAMYHLLKDDLHITRKRVTLFLDNERDFQSGGTHPYVSDSGVTMVPARFLAERLGAEVQWEEAKRSVRVRDEYSGTDVELALGSGTAYVNGEPKPLDSPVVMKNGTTFVPLRFIAEALGGRVEWDNGSRMVTIVKE